MDADRILAVAGSVVIHLTLVGVLAFNMWESPEPPAAALNKPIIQARAVDEATAMEPVRRREAEERRKREEAERKQKAAEAEKKRRAEEKRKKIAAEKKRKAEAEKKRKAEALRKKAEAEKKRKAELKRKQEEENKRLAEEQRKKEEAERKRKEEEDLARRKAELQRQMDLEAERMNEENRQQRRQQLSRQQSQYVADIQNKVGRNWLRPLGSTGTLCTVLINQIPSGDVTGVRVADCDGDMAFQQSVERAVRKASPLPLPADPELFQREIEFVFRP